MTKPNEYEKKTYKWRQHSESLDPSYCGSCSIEVHMRQMSDPECWVQSAVRRWKEDWDHNERLKKHGLSRSSTVMDCLNSLDATARGERSADQEVERLRERLEVEQTCNRCGHYHGKEPCQDLLDENAMLIREMSRIDDKWLVRLREQAEVWDLRTAAIKNQLNVLIEMTAQNRLLRPPTMILKGGEVGKNYNFIGQATGGCTWPVGDCQCQAGDQEDK